MRLLFALSVLAGLAVAPAFAQVPVSGAFTATKACPALVSIRQQSNPDNTMVEVSKTYRVTGKNRPDATFYQIVVDGAQPSQRWVNVDCGTLGGEAAGAGSGARATHVLALGWEPAFCREHREKAECAAMTAQSADANQLSLHGLWPQPRGTAYCRVDRELVQADKAHRWDALPEPPISAATRQRLAAVMPGVQSGLERHEWIVHGTCYGGPADGYFSRAAALAEQVNAGPVRALFAEHVGGAVAVEDVRAAFDQAFGAGAGARVTMSCQGNGPARHVSELVISLAGDVAGSAPLASLIQAAAPVQPGCPSGLVDRPAH